MKGVAASRPRRRARLTSGLRRVGPASIRSAQPARAGAAARCRSRSSAAPTRAARGMRRRAAVRQSRPAAKNRLTRLTVDARRSGASSDGEHVDRQRAAAVADAADRPPTSAATACVTGARCPRRRRANSASPTTSTTRRPKRSLTGPPSTCASSEPPKIAMNTRPTSPSDAVRSAARDRAASGRAPP